MVSAISVPDASHATNGEKEISKRGREGRLLFSLSLSGRKAELVTEQNGTK